MSNNGNQDQRAACPFSLPDAPIDQYRVVWWQVEAGRVVTMTAVYHTDTKWSDNHSGPGVDFINQWQIFCGVQFVGRSLDGWVEAFSDWDWSGSCSTRERALQIAADFLVSRIALLEDDLQGCRSLLAEYRRELP